jgi:hypothetical protein
LIDPLPDQGGGFLLSADWKNFPGPENISFLLNPENPALLYKNQEKQQVVNLMQSGMSVAI